VAGYYAHPIVIITIAIAPKVGGCELSAILRFVVSSILGAMGTDLYLLGKGRKTRLLIGRLKSEPTVLTCPNLDISTRITVSIQHKKDARLNEHPICDYA